MKRRFDTRCTPSRFRSEEHYITFVIRRAETMLRISGSYRNCFHGALQFRHTRSTVVDEMSEAILRRFEVDAKSFIQLLQVQQDAPCD